MEEEEIVNEREPGLIIQFHSWFKYTFFSDNLQTYFLFYPTPKEENGPRIR